MTARISGIRTRLCCPIAEGASLTVSESLILCLPNTQLLGLVFQRPFLSIVFGWGAHLSQGYARLDSLRRITAASHIISSQT